MKLYAERLPQSFSVVLHLNDILEFNEEWSSGSFEMEQKILSPVIGEELQKEALHYVYHRRQYGMMY